VVQLRVAFTPKGVARGVCGVQQREQPWKVQKGENRVERGEKRARRYRQQR